MLQSLKEHNINNILALRGDPPLNQPDFDFSKNIYSYASELIKHIKKFASNDFCIAAAAYIEGHINSKRIKDDLKYLKEKVDCVFLDPFSPKKTPELWTREFFNGIFKIMKPGAKLATYSCARVVRDNLKAEGFTITDGPKVGRRGPSTIAEKPSL